MAIPTVFPDRLPALTTLRLADAGLAPSALDVAQEGGCDRFLEVLSSEQISSELLWMWLRKVDGDRFLEVAVLLSRLAPSCSGCGSEGGW